MPKYTVTAFAGLHLPKGTLVRLSPEQSRPRAHQIGASPRGEGWFTAGETLTFRAGEVVETEFALPAGLAVLTDSPAEPSAPSKAAQPMRPGTPARRRAAPAPAPAAA